MIDDFAVAGADQQALNLLIRTQTHADTGFDYIDMQADVLPGLRYPGVEVWGLHHHIAQSIDHLLFSFGRC